MTQKIAIRPDVVIIFYLQYCEVSEFVKKMFYNNENCYSMVSFYKIILFMR